MLYSYLSNFSDSKIFDKITTLMNTDNIIPSLILKEYINLIKEDAFQNVINEVLNEILINENFSPLWISSSEFPIIATKNSVLSLRYNDENNEQESIYGVPGDIYLTLLSSEGKTSIDIFEINSKNYSLNFLKKIDVKKIRQFI